MEHLLHAHRVVPLQAGARSGLKMRSPRTFSGRAGADRSTADPRPVVNGAVTCIVPVSIRESNSMVDVGVVPPRWLQVIA